MSLLDRVRQQAAKAPSPTRAPAPGSGTAPFFGSWGGSEAATPAAPVRAIHVRDQGAKPTPGAPLIDLAHGLPPVAPAPVMEVAPRQLPGRLPSAEAIMASTPGPPELGVNLLQMVDWPPADQRTPDNPANTPGWDDDQNPAYYQGIQPISVAPATDHGGGPGGVQ